MAVLIFWLWIISPVFASVSDDVASLNDAILKKKQEIQEINAKIAGFQKNIDQEKSKSASFMNQMALIKNKISKLELDIQSIRLGIEEKNLEISALQGNIDLKGEKINGKKDDLGNIIKSIDKMDRENKLKILVQNVSFSNFFDQIKYLEDLQTNLLLKLGELKSQKQDLEDKSKELAIKKNELQDKKELLEKTTLSLEEQRVARSLQIKASLKSQTRLGGIVAELRDEITRVNDDIASIKNTIKDKIKNSDQFKLGEAVILSWPVDPKKGISTYFYDPEYPFRYIFEHPGIDIRAPQGTPVKAAAPGYVVKARDAGMGYSYIILIHFDNTITVYGHVSRIDVKNDQLVERGQVIGLSGGTPRTRGAGNLSTGPHLHLEVRKSNTPVNPLDYLVSIY
ncbi:MAG: peptidoglycan DD-metalloendopeptidase family protein [Patescibacteria group bacterium]